MPRFINLLSKAKLSSTNRMLAVESVHLPSPPNGSVLTEQDVEVYFPPHLISG